jgi:hypothetical protein
LKTIEIYDDDLNTWKLCGSMNYRRLGGGVGVVKLQSSSQLLLLNANSSNKVSQISTVQTEQQTTISQQATTNILALIGAASSLSVTNPITALPLNSIQQQSAAAASGALMQNITNIETDHMNPNNQNNR